jgi:ABC-type lipoprotein release transport system permease subunit
MTTHGPNLRSIAWRNLWRNRRRTVVTLSSIAFGVLLAGTLTGMADWRWTEVINLGARMGAGHVTLQHPEFLDLPSLGRTVRWSDVDRDALLANPGVARTVMRVSGQVMLATAGESLAASFVAFDPAVEDENTLSMLPNVVEGEMLPRATGRGIVLGERLAELLGTRLGRKVVYTVTDKNGEIVSELARVTGIVRTGAPSVDARLCLLPIGTIREVLGYAADEGTQIAVFLEDHRESYAMAARLGTTFDSRVAAVTWAELQPDLAGFIAIKVGGMIFMELLILLLIGAGIFNTLFMSVMERLREFGILMAIGFSPGRLFRLVMWESLWLGIVGIVVGVVVTAWPYWALATKGIDLSGLAGDANFEIAGGVMEPVLRVAIYPENALYIAAVILGATLLAGLYPAWRAGRVVPVESIKLV